MYAYIYISTIARCNTIIIIFIIVIITADIINIWVSTAFVVHILYTYEGVREASTSVLLRRAENVWGERTRRHGREDEEGGRQRDHTRHHGDDDRVRVLESVQQTRVHIMWLDTCIKLEKLDV